jgi:DNA modification methylase
VYWSKSVINKPYPPNLQHKLRSNHGGQKPPDLCGDLIEVFTTRGQWVLDPFAGVGGTLLGAALRERNAVGIEINPRWTRIYAQVCSLEEIPEQRMICGDSRLVLPELAREGHTFDLVLTDVPYWGMDKAQKSKGRYKRVGEESRQARRSKLAEFNQSSYGSKEQWLDEIASIFSRASDLLKERGYLVVFIGDMYNGGRCHFLSCDLAAALSELALVPKANLVWYDVSKALHIYGYQYEYIPSMIHQNILVFRKQA